MLGTEVDKDLRDFTIVENLHPGRQEHHDREQGSCDPKNPLFGFHWSGFKRVKVEVKLVIFFVLRGLS
ncbi:hypothetical protein BST99_07955 [Aureicoccus marinus]|uniref:Uncharacterized protein n=1 Tax=Aureicoccus marinus TaxID=754435 RepID=A0A2S7T6W1_9FLAO|nr:hypothetical protein BST99_07955 [Aureicoccus marinus]